MRRRLLSSYLALTLVVLIILEVPLALSYGSRERNQVTTGLERDAYQIANYSEETLEGDAHHGGSRPGRARGGGDRRRRRHAQVVHERQASYANLRVQAYDGRSVLTCWETDEAPIKGGTSQGVGAITELDHKPIATIGADGAYAPDEHELLITDRDSVLITAYRTVTADLSSVGGSRKGKLRDAYWEEVDLKSGKVLTRWNALDHIPLSESQQVLPDDGVTPYDFVHLNSVSLAPDGNILLSSRHTWTVYKLHRTTGAILWRLGGKSSDFPVPPGALFGWQHHAVFEGDHTVRIFDNGPAGKDTSGNDTTLHPSRALWIDIDESARTATLRHSLTHPEKLQATSMGDVQRLPNGNVLVGWGSVARVSEFSPTDELLFDAQLPSASYRVFKFADGDTAI